LSKRVWYDYWKYEQEVLDAINDPVIIHFTSPDKPWITCEDDINPYNSSFYKYQDQTKWKGVRYERRSSDHQIMKNHFFDIPPVDS
jgi:lipopolysaccharide biosynthesis glycosyltransferase